MATFGEIVYMAGDQLRAIGSDDSFITEEHLLFLAARMRAMLLSRRYSRSRNKAFAAVPDSDRQTICLDLGYTDLGMGGCADGWLASKVKVPDTLDIYTPKVGTIGWLNSCHITLIPPERMPYVGHNKWLRHIIYVTIGSDGRLYLHSVNPQFLNLRKVRMEAVFSDPAEAAALACDVDGESVQCDILDTAFPLEDGLVASCIEMMVQELSGTRYAPADGKNDAKDNLSELMSPNARTATPVQDGEDQRRNEQQ